MSIRISIPCWFAITILFISGCASTTETTERKTPVEPAYRLQIAKQLIQSRQHQKATIVLKQYLNRFPESTDAIFLLGRAWFAMAKYKKAAKSFRRVLVLSPDHSGARHRLWAARLQADYSSTAIKKTIRSEIEAILAKNSPAPVEMLTAYYGYRYLWDQQNQQRVIRNIATRKLSKQIRKRVAEALVYEIITARKKNTRTRLAELYQTHFLGMADDTIAASWLFSNDTVKNNLRRLETRLHKYTGSDRNNIAANLYAAHALIRNNHKLSTAISLLQTNLGLIKQYNANGPDGLELARNNRQLGIALFKQKQFRPARKNLARAVKLQPDNGTAAYYLGKIAETLGNHDTAIAFYRKALESDGQQTGVRGALVRLLGNRLKEKTPSQFFADQEGIVVFKNVTGSAGLNNVSSHRVAWGDYDNDGDDDLLVNGTRLFNNNKGIFADVTDATGIPRIGNATGGIWGDYNNDGYLDIFVTTNGSNRLLENVNGKLFRDVSTDSLPKTKTAFSEAAAWGDYNGDGYLDLYVANYQQPAVERGICSHDSLLRNIKGMRFVQANNATLPRPDEALCGRGVTWADIDGDGTQDIFVANYRLDPNFLWLKDGQRFLEKGQATSVAGNDNNGYYGNSIGSLISDFDNNGELDLFTSNLSHPRDRAFSDKSQLYLQNRNRNFERQRQSGIGYEETYSDPAAADVDNDGDVDLFISAIYSSGQSHLFLNNGKGYFRDVSWLSGARMKNTWGSAFSDYDNDGDMDLIVASKDGIRLLRNDGPGGHWIKVSLRSVDCNIYGVGTRVEIRYQNRSQVRVITAGRGTGNQDSLSQLFGLGNYQGPVELSIKDSCGHTFKRNLPDVDRHYLLTN